MKKLQHILMAACTVLIISTPACAQKKQTAKKSSPAKTEMTQAVSADSVAQIRKAAAEGDAAAQNTLGVWLYNGENVKKDYKAAFLCWEQAARQNHPSALGNLGMCYQYGRGVEKDSIKAVYYYEQSIRKGNTELLDEHAVLAAKKKNLFSARLLSECYSAGIGVKADPAKSIDFLRICADNGDDGSAYELALYYINNEKADKAYPIFERLAKKGHVGSIYYCGWLRLQGRGVAQDKALAMTYLQRADSAGFATAAYRLGDVYMQGNGVEKDAKKAVEYYKKAAGENSQAKWALAECCRKGIGTKVDYYRASQLYAEVILAREKDFKEIVKADEGGSFSQYLKGMRLYCLAGEKQKALDTFAELRKNKMTDGAIMEAVVLADPDFEKGNAKKAAKTLKKYAPQSALAAWHLSRLTEQGRGVKKDAAQALSLLRQAAQGGVAEAQSALAARLMKGDGMAVDYTEAAKWYLRLEAAKRLSKDDAANLAQLYRQKIAELPDLDQAEKRIKQLEKLRPMDKFEQLLKSAGL